MLYTNPRGSTGYGEKFTNEIKNAYPGKDFDDLMAGVDTVVGRGYIDTKNMFVYGCSGGGVLTAWTVGHTDRFAAAASLCPVIDWISFVGETDGAGWYENFEKPFWEDPSEYLRALADHVRRQREDADDADDGRARSPHADSADRGVLSRAQDARRADGDDPHEQRVPRHVEHAVELPAHAALSAELVRQVRDEGHERGDDDAAGAVGVAELGSDSICAKWSLTPILFPTFLFSRRAPGVCTLPRRRQWPNRQRSPSRCTCRCL